MLGTLFEDHIIIPLTIISSIRENETFTISQCGINTEKYSPLQGLYRWTNGDSRYISITRISEIISYVYEFYEYASELMKNCNDQKDNEFLRDMIEQLKRIVSMKSSVEEGLCKFRSFDRYVTDNIFKTKITTVINFWVRTVDKIKNILPEKDDIYLEENLLHKETLDTIEE